MSQFRRSANQADSTPNLVSRNGAAAAAFVLTRLTMAAVILGSLFLGGFEAERSALLLVQVAVAATSVAAVALSVLSLTQLLRGSGQPSTRPLLLILMDSILAIGVMTVINVDTSPLAWVALITPVLETAMLFSISRAAFVWIGLSLAFLGLRLTTSASDDATTETLILSIQQVLAVLFVSGPAALMADSAQDRIQKLASARHDADQTAERLRAISQSAHEMSGLASLGDILSHTARSVTTIGFDQGDIVVKDARGNWTVHSSSSNGPAAVVSPEILSIGDGAAPNSIDAGDPTHGQALQLAGLRSGHRMTLGKDKWDDQANVVLRVWSKRDLISNEDVQSLALLGGHAREAYRAAEVLQAAQLHADQLLHEVRHDSLTGLANRSYVLETLASSIATAQPLALFFIDLDGFKTVNDSLGHKAGDDALIAVAERLRANGRDGSLAGRVGGDEFVMLVPTTRFESIESLAEYGNQIVQSVSEPIVAEGQHAQLGASIGIAVHDGHVGPDQFVSLADNAMYEAKRQGGGVQVSPASLTKFAQRAAS